MFIIERLNYNNKEVPSEYLGFIYLTFFLNNGKIYIGKTTKRVEQIYFGSGGKEFQKIKKEFGTKNMIRIVLKFCNTRKDLEAFETFYCKYYKSSYPEIGYNFFDGGLNDFSIKNPNKTKQFKDSQSKFMIENNPMKSNDSDKFKKSISKNTSGELNHFFGKKHTEETKKKLSLLFKGKKLDFDVWNKGKNLKNDPRFAETYEKMKTNNPAKKGDEHWTRRKMNENKKILLALDPAENFGWSVEGSCGTWNFKLKRDESFSYKLLRFEDKLAEIVKMKNINVVAFERPSGQNSAALMSHSKFIAVIEMFCTKNNIPYVGYSASEIKKHATGKGNSGKPLMIAAAKDKLGYEGNDDNEADALWIYDLFMNK